MGPPAYYSGSSAVSSQLLTLQPTIDRPHFALFLPRTHSIPELIRGMTSPSDIRAVTGGMVCQFEMRLISDPYLGM
jgi:hypothetical protein